MNLKLYSSLNLRIYINIKCICIFFTKAESIFENSFVQTNLKIFLLLLRREIVWLSYLAFFIWFMPWHIHKKNLWELFEYFKWILAMERLKFVIEIKFEQWGSFFQSNFKANPINEKITMTYNINSMFLAGVLIQFNFNNKSKLK